MKQYTDNELAIITQVLVHMGARRSALMLASFMPKKADDAKEYTVKIAEFKYSFVIQNGGERDFPNDVELAELKVQLGV